MLSPSAPIRFTQKSQDDLVDFCKQTQRASWGIINLRERFKTIDIEYQRQNNMANPQHTMSAAANAGGDKRKIQDIVIPIIEPQVETGLAYLASVFLTGVPIFGIVADRNNSEAGEQMEAVMSENSVRGGWARQFLKFFRDGLKYNFHAIEVAWCSEKVYSIDDKANMRSKQGNLQEVVWEGNNVKRLDPYNVIYDPRIEITEQHKKAEFVGYVEVHNRVSMMQFLHSLPFRMNVTKALESTPQMASGAAGYSLYYVPQVNTDNMSAQRFGPNFNWDLWASGGSANSSNPDRLQYKNAYVVVTRYIRMIPKDFGIAVPAAGQVQIWKIITVNDAVIVYAERQTNAHNYLPILFGQPIEDGLNLQTKSFAQKQIPMQDIASSLANSRLAGRRRLITDRALYDPSRINEKDINTDSPTAKIPVKPSAYGQPLDKAFYPIPFRDDQTQTLMGDVREVMGYADYLSGQNKAQQGQFVKGNKTLQEYEDVQSKSSGRQQTMAISIEHQVMQPCKEILKMNILQYQPSGQVFSYAKQAPVNVDPLTLRKASLSFKVSDGLIPSEKLMGGRTLEAAFQAVGTSQTLAEEYSIGGIFEALMDLGGLDISQYKFTPEEQKQRQIDRLKLAQAQGHVEAQTAGKVAAAEAASQPPVPQGQ